MKAGHRAIMVFVILLLTSSLAAGATSASAHVLAGRTGHGKITVTRGAHEDAIRHSPGRTSASSVASSTAPDIQVGGPTMPSTSPAVYHYFQSSININAIPCNSGYVCAAVPYGNNGYEIFNFYYYGTYGLTYWHRYGGIKNVQTGGAAARLLDVNGNQISCIAAGEFDNIDWDPVYYIKLTSSHC